MFLPSGNVYYLLFFFLNTKLHIFLFKLVRAFPLRSAAGSTDSAFSCCIPCVSALFWVFFVNLSVDQGGF